MGRLEDEDDIQEQLDQLGAQGKVIGRIVEPSCQQKFLDLHKAHQELKTAAEVLRARKVLVENAAKEAWEQLYKIRPDLRDKNAQVQVNTWKIIEFEETTMKGLMELLSAVHPHCPKCNQCLTCSGCSCENSTVLN